MFISNTTVSEFRKNRAVFFNRRFLVGDTVYAPNNKKFGFVLTNRTLGDRLLMSYDNDVWIYVDKNVMTTRFILIEKINKIFIQTTI